MIAVKARKKMTTTTSTTTFTGDDMSSSLIIKPSFMPSFSSSLFRSAVRWEADELSVSLAPLYNRRASVKASPSPLPSPLPSPSPSVSVSLSKSVSSNNRGGSGGSGSGSSNEGTSSATINDLPVCPIRKASLSFYLKIKHRGGQTF